MDTQGRVPAPIALPARPSRPGALVVTDADLLDAVARLAAADGASVAAASLEVVTALVGVRAGLVARSPLRGSDPVVLASSGYDCAEMAPGAVLPRDAGLPVTECVRTGELRVAGTGPSWVAVPAGPGAALLLSLVVPPPDDAGLARLVRLGAVLGPALQRAREDARTRTDLLVLEEGLRARDGAAAGLVVRSRPFRAPLCGDVVDLVEDGRQRWLLLADVCGRGHAAAVGADRLRAAFRACAAGAGGPAEVLRRLDRALGGGEEDFATALVLRLDGPAVLVASAGHPAPLLVPGGRVPLVPAPPLGLRVDGPWPGGREVGLVLPAGTRLLLATDGLVDRGHEVDLDALVAALPAALPGPELADAVLLGCDAAGPAQDDVTLAVLGPGRCC